jgi:dephospho-CoA kinase
MNIIVAGEAGAGKDTFADLVASLQPQTRRFAFGDELRIAEKNLRLNGVNVAYAHIAGLFGANVPQTLLRKLQEIKELPSNPPKYRERLQALGTYCVGYDDTIWIRVVRDKAMAYSNVVITDARRLHELNAFPGYIKVFIDAPLEIRTQRLAQRDGGCNEKTLRHKAESEIASLRDLCDYVVNNDTDDIKDLQRKVEEVLYGKV